MRVKWMRGRYFAWCVTAVLLLQTLLLWVAWQLEADDPLMGLTDAGFLLLPGSVFLRFASWFSLRIRQWLGGLLLALLSLLGLLLSGWSLYMHTL